MRAMKLNAIESGFSNNMRAMHELCDDLVNVSQRHFSRRVEEKGVEGIGQSIDNAPYRSPAANAYG